MELIERLLLFNPWWENKRVDEIEGFKERTLMKEILKYREDKQAIAIVGLRRVGKTVLMKQVIGHLLDDIDEKRIMYFSFDELLGKEPEIIEKVITVYENEILKDELREVYIFLDEINPIENWQVILKRYYDLSRNIKFIVSGSSSTIRKTKESLAGRIYEFELNPLSFEEFLYLKDIEIEDILIQSGKLKKELNNYLFYGGFPEIISEKNFEKIKKYISSIIDKIIFHDIPKIHGVSEPELMREILSLIARKPGMILKYQSIASSLNVSYQTISKYIVYLERAFLIRRVYNRRGSPIASARKAKKAYLSTSSLAAAFSHNETELIRILPQLAENAVAEHIGAKFFWRKYHEIDFLHNDIPIEVKYGDSIDMGDIKGALDASKNINAKELVIVTKDTEKMEIADGLKINYIPLWKFLLKFDSG
ncbi:MAG: hypothetical protein A7316_02725 [Candidatus Altiarchaeales archaeon WOR_SM1_86-2]|nr:MAG: hypothetical protein A7316_02725 [Candidatus Altiarchaeales archaeon WOR_SM1_86-2]